uniref:Uncharacterized protein n=1 Tax=Octopus bimaculoides TaxID=37653 RepID=A0A0L8FT25_OCTBM
MKRLSINILSREVTLSIHEVISHFCLKYLFSTTIDFILKGRGWGEVSQHCN